MSASDPAAAPAPKRNRLRIPLIASVILNLFFLGALGGWALSGHHGPPPPGAGGGGGRGAGDVWHWFRNLPESRQDDLKAMFESGRETRRARRAEIDAAWDEAVRALGAAPYAPQALEAALDRLREQGDSLTAEAYRDLLPIVGRMTEAERIAYAERLRRPPSHRPPAPEGDRGEGRPPR